MHQVHAGHAIFDKGRPGRNWMDSTERKMCVVVPCNLGKGDAALSRCIPLAVALTRHRARSHQ